MRAETTPSSRSWDSARVTTTTITLFRGQPGTACNRGSSIQRGGSFGRWRRQAWRGTYSASPQRKWSASCGPHRLAGQGSDEPSNAARPPGGVGAFPGTRSARRVRNRPACGSNAAAGNPPQSSAMNGTHGTCDPRFAAVGEALDENLDEEIGAAVVVRVAGRVVVDLCGGWADAARTRPWRQETVVDVFSSGKACVALTVLSLGLDLDKPVWQEATLRHVLTHQAGHPAIRADVPPRDIFDWDAIV